MKKLITVLLLLMLTLTACGGQTTSEDAGAGTETEESTSLFNDKSPDGEWVSNEDDEDYKETLTIDGDTALLILWTGSAIKGKVNREDSTIEFSGLGFLDKAISDYEVVGDKLVLTTEAEKNGGEDFRTIAFSRPTKTE